MIDKEMRKKIKKLKEIDRDLIHILDDIKTHIYNTKPTSFLSIYIKNSWFLYINKFINIFIYIININIILWLSFVIIKFFLNGLLLKKIIIINIIFMDRNNLYLEEKLQYYLTIINFTDI